MSSVSNTVPCYCGPCNTSAQCRVWYSGGVPVHRQYCTHHRRALSITVQLKTVQYNAVQYGTVPHGAGLYCGGLTGRQDGAGPQWMQGRSRRVGCTSSPWCAQEHHKRRNARRRHQGHKSPENKALLKKAERGKQEQEESGGGGAGRCGPIQRQESRQVPQCGRNGPRECVSVAAVAPQEEVLQPRQGPQPRGQGPVEPILVHGSA